MMAWTPLIECERYYSLEWHVLIGLVASGGNCQSHQDKKSQVLWFVAWLRWCDENELMGFEYVTQGGII